MKRYKIVQIIIIALFFCAFFSCKKDYPKDIPEWLKKTIQEHKRNNDACGDYGCLVINEYMFKDSCLVYSYEGYESQIVTFFDVNGNRICLKNNANTWWFDKGSNYCVTSTITLHSGTNLPPLKATRVIWAAYK